ncbi:hypothetical protein HDU76_005395 [Blyttiomyces sp. JEL0837]|nr:hypothetical protein HDU76_005395 [Blyttiomyces sp. JEL0837]
MVSTAELTSRPFIFFYISATLVALTTFLCIGASASLAWYSKSIDGVTIDIGFFGGARICGGGYCNNYDITCSGSSSSRSISSDKICGKIKGGDAMLVLADLIVWGSWAGLALFFINRTTMLFRYIAMGSMAGAAFFMFIQMCIAASLKQAINDESPYNVDYGTAFGACVVSWMFALGTAACLWFTFKTFDDQEKLAPPAVAVPVQTIVYTTTAPVVSA